MSDLSDDSISGWLQQLQAGDAAAIQELWEKFFSKLVVASEAQMRKLPPISADGEDVAASVFRSIWNGAREGRFRKLKSLDEVWWCLLRMAKRKCIDRVRNEGAQKRGGNSQTLPLDGIPADEFHKLVSEEPDPEFVATFNEELFRLTDLLPDKTAKEIAVLTVEGHSAEEIAPIMGLSLSSVYRKLRIVRKIWKNELDT